jgi:hypothetical protein
MSIIDFGDHFAKRSRPSRDTVPGIHDDDLIRVAPHGQVGSAVAGIVEAFDSVAADKFDRFRFALEIALTIGGDDFVKEAEVICDCTRRLRVSRRHEHDPTPRLLLSA